MKKMSTIIIFSLVILIGVIVALVDSGEFNTRNDKQKNPPATEWLTYKNDKYGFEFKYPSDYDIESETITGGNPVPYVTYHILFKLTDTRGVDKGWFSLYVYDKKNWDNFNQNASESPLVSKNPTIYKYTNTDYFGNIYKYYGIIGEKYSLSFDIEGENDGLNDDIINTIKNSFTWLSNNS